MDRNRKADFALREVIRRSFGSEIISGLIKEYANYSIRSGCVGYGRLIIPIQSLSGIRTPQCLSTYLVFILTGELLVILSF